MRWQTLAILLIVGARQVCATEALGRVLPQLSDSIAGAECARFTDYYINASNKVFKLNPRCWARKLDVSSCSVWNSNKAGHPTGTLITPRHVIFAMHYPMRGIESLTFVSRSGEAVTRQLVRTEKLFYESHLVPDLSVGLLSHDIPTNAIMPAYVLPPDFAKSLPRAPPERLPAVWLNQHKEVSIWDVWPTDDTRQVVLLPTEHGRFKAYHRNIVYYDSGSPVYGFIDGRPVLLTVWTQGSGNNGVGTSVAAYADAVNGLIEKLSPGEGYKLQILELGGGGT